MQILAPNNPKDRFDVYRFFNGLSEEAKEGLDKRLTRVPLVKTFLLEHVRQGKNRPVKNAVAIFGDLGANIRVVDDNFFEIKFPLKDVSSNQESITTTGFLEQYDERFFAYYTSEESAEAKKRVAKWILPPDLDYAWFSSPFLLGLWNRDISQRGDYKFGKLVFKHESIFDMPEDFSEIDEGHPNAIEETLESDDYQEDVSFEDRHEPERRNARFAMGDKIGKIRTVLSKLQKDYEPLNSLYSIRIPSRTCKGGHDLYQNGQLTNRTDSFEDHRNTIRYLYRIYSSVLNATEDIAWHEIKEQNRLQVGMKGVPLIIRFSESLSEKTFDRWVQMVFQKRNRFKLWGDPIRLGPSKVHVYGADRHLWQPINLELTRNGVMAILPQGTCGNTFHRLIANIQHYVSPKFEAFLGGKPFEELVQKWPSPMELSDEN